MGLIDWEDWLALDADEGEAPPQDGEEYLDPDGCELPWGEDLAAVVAETGQVMAERAADAEFLARPGTAELAWDLEVRLPGTRALFRDGRLRHAKVVIIARQTAALDAEEARQAEEQVLGQAAGLSPGRRLHRRDRPLPGSEPRPGSLISAGRDTARRYLYAGSLRRHAGEREPRT